MNFVLINLNIPLVIDFLDEWFWKHKRFRPKKHHAKYFKTCTFVQIFFGPRTLYLLLLFSFGANNYKNNDMYINDFQNLSDIGSLASNTLKFYSLFFYNNDHKRLAKNTSFYEDIDCEPTVWSPLVSCMSSVHLRTHQFVLLRWKPSHPCGRGSQLLANYSISLVALLKKK